MLTGSITAALPGLASAAVGDGCIRAGAIMQLTEVLSGFETGLGPLLARLGHSPQLFGGRRGESFRHEPTESQPSARERRRACPSDRRRGPLRSGQALACRYRAAGRADRGDTRLRVRQRLQPWVRAPARHAAATLAQEVRRSARVGRFLAPWASLMRTVFLRAACVRGGFLKQNRVPERTFS